MDEGDSYLKTPLEILQTVFGYENFHPGQEEIIDHVCAGKDAMVLMPTGGGKSLCFQIPAMIRSGVGVVISPLIALMQDQVDALQEYGIRAAFLNSSLTSREAAAIEKQMRDGRYDLLYVAPERLLTERFQSLLAQCQIALFAIDEAHCVSQWGHDFRPEYIQLSILHEKYPRVPRIALTATADQTTRREIIDKLGLTEARQFIFSFNRPNIRYRVVPKRNPKQQLFEFIRWEHQDESGIVYCLSRNKVEETAEWLNSQGYSALPYHAGLDAETRRSNQQRFLKEDGLIIVATVAFGMGIDKPDVRFVAHLDLPKSLESYYQETGRAGRDGLRADAWMAYSLADVVMLRKILDSSEANEQFKMIEQRKLDRLLGYCETSQCRRQVMLGYFNEDLPEPCDNCDTCLDPVETWDGSIAAQKALSCVYRTGQRFGAGHLIDVLRGVNNDRVHRFGHQNVSTFGIGQEFSVIEWKSIFRQLIAANLLSIDISGFGGFQLTPKSKAVLRGEQTVQFRKDPSPVKKRRSKVSAVEPDFDQSDPVFQNCWEKLRTLRRQLADQLGKPPYVIFHDATLREMARIRPKTLEEMLRISGVGTTKLERYGKRFLQIFSEPLPDEPVN